MLMPKKSKHRKEFKGRIRGKATRGNTIAYGQYALQAQGHARITSRQIESARQAMTRYIKRGGKIWIRIFPHTPVTRKPLDVKMGSGKGNPEFFAARVRPGVILFEMEGVSPELAKEAMRLAAHKLPIKTKFLVKEGAAEAQEQYLIDHADDVIEPEPEPEPGSEEVKEEDKSEQEGEES